MRFLDSGGGGGGSAGGWAAQARNATAVQPAMPRRLSSVEPSWSARLTNELLSVAVALGISFMPFVLSEFVSAYAIPSRSMDETLKVGDVVLAEKLSSLLSLPVERGDIVFFSPPDELRDIVSDNGGRVGPRDRFVKRTCRTDHTRAECTRELSMPAWSARVPTPRCAHALVLWPCAWHTGVAAVSGDEVAVDARGGVYVNGKAYTLPVLACAAPASRATADEPSDTAVQRQVGELVAAGKLDQSEAAALVRNLAPPQEATAEGAVELWTQRTRSRVFGNVEARLVDPRQLGTNRIVPSGHVFLLGDCEARSTDSRVWGPLRASRIVARPVVRVWPPERAGPLDDTDDLNPFRRELLRFRAALDEAVRNTP
jgi:signal peptidase I